MTKKLYLDKELPENAKEEIILLYNIGVEIEDLEYLISVKLKEDSN